MLAGMVVGFAIFSVGFVLGMFAMTILTQSKVVFAIEYDDPKQENNPQG